MIYLSIREASLELHEKNKGKLGVYSKVQVKSREDLGLAYTPGVAEPCMEIAKNVEDVYKYTGKSNSIAVISDGTAVLGLGDIGPEASMPVMEGKCILFKEFADIDAYPIILSTKNTEEIIMTIKNIYKGFGGINLEDISAPRCFEIEERLKAELDIPVFHDDQHGTAIVALAGIINALKIVKKSIADIKIVINGAGAAGIAIGNLLISEGAKNIIFLGSKGILESEKETSNKYKREIAEKTNPSKLKGNLKEAIVGADLFIGVSGPNLLTEEMVKSMNTDPIIFALANPTPEIMPDIAIKSGARVVATGRSDFPNQINNVLVFPGIFRGALDIGAKEINEEMKIAAAYGIANLVSDEELNEEYIIPGIFDERVAQAVANEVKRLARETNVIR